jgi:hypothetical protein
MRCQRGGRAAVISLTVLMLLLADGLTAGASADTPDGDGGGQDVATPPVDATAQLSVGRTLSPGIQARARLDDFRYDAQNTRGYARDVCYGRLRPGTARAFTELQRRFGGSAGTLYACRERWNAAEEPDCNGTLVDPRVNGDFFSTCWSNHAAGRALDVMSTKARGDAIVNWLLAPDAAGNYSANARRLGVMQILWWDRCWNTDDDRGVVSVKKMRKCGIGHFDHVHVDLTFRGANGRTSYWGGTPQVSRKLNGLMSWDSDTGSWRTQSWFNFQGRDRAASRWSPRWDRILRGDWDRDRVDDDMLVWDRDTGRWSTHRWARHRRRTIRNGAFSTNYDEVVGGDWNGTGRTNDLFMWNRNTGQWGVRTFSAKRSRFGSSGQFPVGYDAAYAGDFDEDNRHDDMFIIDNDTGRWQVLSWSGYRPTMRASGTWAARFTQFVIGDWDSDGELNDMLVRDPVSGQWKMASWNGFRHRWRGPGGTWRAKYRQIVAADLDGEGRVDDMLLRSRRSGRVIVVEWRYYRWGTRFNAAGDPNWDQVISGAWG